MKSHGGARKGAGKPAQFEKPMKRKEVMLPDEAIDFFLALGEGNLSAGVRQAWRSLTKRALDAGDSAASQAFSPLSSVSTSEKLPAATQRK